MEVIPAVHSPVLLVAAYCRVSTDLEEQEGSLESQTAHCSLFTDLSFLFLKFINDFYSIPRVLTIKKTVKGEEVLSFGTGEYPISSRDAMQNMDAILAFLGKSIQDLVTLMKSSSSPSINHISFINYPFTGLRWFSGALGGGSSVFLFFMWMDRKK